ncbi:MAG: Response regulator c-di-GMP phosphodiesterase [Thermodesulfobacterium sp.]|uniref:Response regulator c-di-GMP phosphodiesterase n=1 Tax=Candidatus Thermodesulfobacterium syntrophicum TaxID=3060442 RepID=A0AAE3P3U6_9BACT|nr:Response regulator c-di-GMP phosphodiesterase [Candidatus Thermodesulfobacterium syntrophicum]
MVYLALSESLFNKLVKLLEGYKIKYKLIEDGETLLELAKKDPPKLIILEKDLPLLDGFAVTLLLKSDDKTKGIPILAVCKCKYKEEEVKAKDCGVDDIITCPLEKKETVEKLEKWLKGVK